MTRKPALSVALLLVAMIAAVSGAGAQSPASATVWLATALQRQGRYSEASLAVLDDPHLDAASPAAWATFTLIGEPDRNGS